MTRAASAALEPSRALSRARRGPGRDEPGDGPGSRRRSCGARLRTGTPAARLRAPRWPAATSRLCAATAARRARSRAPRSTSTRRRRAAPTTRRSSLHAPAAAMPPTATASACAHVFSLPRSRAAMTTPFSIAARRSPEIEELACHDRRHHPRRRNAFGDQHHERRHHQHLVGDRIEERAERRRLIPAPGEPAVDLIRRHRDDEDGRRPVRVVGEIPREQHDDDGDSQGPAECQLIGDGHP